VGELVAERLLVPENGTSVGAPAMESSGTSNGGRLPYESPMLTTYRDMADLLALDPPMPRLEDIVWEEPKGVTTSKS